ncbi:hypothetical protein ACI8AK_05295 [Geodermatophilus sp. SYSU D00867]
MLSTTIARVARRGTRLLADAGRQALSWLDVRDALDSPFRYEPYGPLERVSGQSETVVVLARVRTRSGRPLRRGLFVTFRITRPRDGGTVVAVGQRPAVTAVDGEWQCVLPISSAQGLDVVTYRWRWRPAMRLPSVLIPPVAPSVELSFRVGDPVSGPAPSPPAVLSPGADATVPFVPAPDRRVSVPLRWRFPAETQPPLVPVEPTEFFILRYVTWRLDGGAPEMIPWHVDPATGRRLTAVYRRVPGGDSPSTGPIVSHTEPLLPGARYVWSVARVADGRPSAFPPSPINLPGLDTMESEGLLFRTPELPTVGGDRNAAATFRTS